MRVLLDTHLLLWALASPSRLSTKALQRIEASEVFASAASIWEISMEVVAAIEPAGFDHLPIAADHAARVAELPPIHKDPIDRILVAQAVVERMILLTDDDALAAYGSSIEVI